MSATLSQPGVSLSRLILSCAEACLSWQCEDGSFPSGHNGPWGNTDTPVRVTAHWLILLIRAQEYSDDPRIRDAARRACIYLLDPQRRPGRAGFQCIVSDDPFLANNGLIGQAWALEALLEAGEDIDPRCLLVALEVASRHAFDDRLGLWRCLGVDGQVGHVHQTLNQQLWFSAIVYKLARRTGQSELAATAASCIERLPEMVGWSGRCVDMLVASRHLLGGRWSAFTQALRNARHPREAYRERGRMYEQAVGYLSFTMYGLALLRDWFPESTLWTNRSFQAGTRKAIEFADEVVFDLPRGRNRFAFSYNPAGIEMAFVKQLFPLGRRSPQEWLSEQLRRHFDPIRGSMTRETGDERILAARVYELCRMKDLTLPGM